MASSSVIRTCRLGSYPRLVLSICVALLRPITVLRGVVQSYTGPSHESATGSGKHLERPHTWQHPLPCKGQP
jgi:hypothetical protein